MQDIWVEVNPVRPAHCSCNGVDRYVREDLVIIDGREHAGELPGKVEFPYEAVGERDTKRAPTEMIHIGDSWERSHVHRLLEGLDR